MGQMAPPAERVSASLRRSLPFPSEVRESRGGGFSGRVIGGFALRGARGNASRISNLVGKMAEQRSRVSATVRFFAILPTRFDTPEALRV